MSQISWLITMALLAMVCFSLLEAAPVSNPEVDARTMEDIPETFSNMFGTILEFKGKLMGAVLYPFHYVIGAFKGESNEIASY